MRQNMASLAYLYISLSDKGEIPMKRLCIYMTYNKENRIYEYIGRALRSLKECCTKLYLVCNYQRIDAGLEYARLYADGVFYRENRGYDSGAYKDALCDFIGWDEVYRYDELILVNDSFFGFFYPLRDTFEKMEGENCDFWGMTGQVAGEFRNPTHRFDAHVHSYFLVFKNTVIKSSAFRDFWEEFVYPENFREAIVNFEFGINARLKQHGFNGKSCMDLYDIRLQRNENPCYMWLRRLVDEYQIPVMKKKCVLIRTPGFAYTLETVTFLRERGLYPTEWIEEYLEKQFYIPDGRMEAPCNSLEIFYENHTNVYIYGAGMCGKNLALYFSYKKWQHSGFIVTDSSGVEDAVSLEEAEIQPGTGVIVSVLDAGTAGEIKRHIGDRCREEQLFFIADCPAIKLPD